MNLDWNGFYEFTLFLFFLLICFFACILVFFINDKKYDLKRLSFNELLFLFMSFLSAVILLDQYSIDFIKDDIKSSEEAKLEKEAVKLEYKNCINNSHVEEYECYLCTDRSSTNCLSYIKTSCKKTVYDVDDSARCEKIVESNKSKTKGWEDLSK